MSASLTIFKSTSVEGIGKFQYSLGDWPAALESNLNEVTRREQHTTEKQQRLGEIYALLVKAVTSGDSTEFTRQSFEKQDINEAERNITAALTKTLDQVTASSDEKIKKIGVILYIFKFNNQIRRDVVRRILLEIDKKLYKVTTQAAGVMSTINESKKNKLKKRNLSRLAAELIAVVNEKNCYKVPILYSTTSREKSKRTPESDTWIIEREGTTDDPSDQEIRTELYDSAITRMQKKRGINEQSKSQDEKPMREKILPRCLLNILGELVDSSSQNVQNPDLESKTNDLDILMKLLSRPCLLDLGQVLTRTGTQIWEQFIINQSASLASLKTSSTRSKTKSTSKTQSLVPDEVQQAINRVNDMFSEHLTGAVVGAGFW